MHRQFIQRLLLAVAVCTAQASWQEPRNEDAVVVGARDLGDLVGGQQSNSNSQMSTEANGPLPPPPTLTSSTTSTSSTTTSTSSSSTTTSSSSSTPPTTPPTTTQSSTSSQTTTSSQPPETTPPPTFSTTYEIIIKTRSDGSHETMTSMSSPQESPGLSNSDGQTSSMPVKTRNTIIGVVVGVGGAIVLAAIALVVWRVWGRKRQGEEHDGLMDYDMSSTSGMEKSDRGSFNGRYGSQNSPFQSTLENYHRPTRADNTSANF